VECLEYILGIELMCGAQAVEDLRPLRPGVGVVEALRILRERVRPLSEDRELAPDMEAAAALVRSGALASIAREEAPWGPLGRNPSQAGGEAALLRGKQDTGGEHDHEVP
jgi:histidine ammonia-lyase